jgi:hypothetical protein
MRRKQLQQKKQLQLDSQKNLPSWTENSSKVHNFAGGPCETQATKEPHKQSKYNDCLQDMFYGSYQTNWSYLQYTDQLNKGFSVLPHLNEFKRFSSHQ